MATTIHIDKVVVVNDSRIDEILSIVKNLELKMSQVADELKAQLSAVLAQVTEVKSTADSVKIIVESQAGKLAELAAAGQNAVTLEEKNEIFGTIGTLGTVLSDSISELHDSVVAGTDPAPVVAEPVA